MRADSGGSDPPPLEDQESFWDEWNRTWRMRDIDSFMERQRDEALAAAHSAKLHNSRILDVGCGTGWLGNALLPFGEVWGIDLSADAIQEGRRRHPGLKLVQGDFLTAALPGQFDFVVSADSLIGMHDQEGFVRRVADLLKPGAMFLLMTPNREVWRRKSSLKPLEHGQVQRWLSHREHLDLLRPFFTVDRVTTLAPGGDRGLLSWVENRYVEGGMARVLGRERWRSLLERARLGRELVFVARRAR